MSTLVRFGSATWAERHHRNFHRVVSVRAPDARPTRFGSREPGSVLTLILTDEDHYFAPTDSHHSYATEETLRDFLAFCTRDNPSSVLVHCQAGVARSAALAACLLLHLSPATKTRTVFQGLSNYRQSGPSDVPLAPTRTILAPAQSVLGRHDLLRAAGETFSHRIASDRARTCAASYGLPHRETAEKLADLLQSDPGLPPLHRDQLTALTA